MSGKRNAAIDVPAMLANARAEAELKANLDVRKAALDAATAALPYFAEEFKLRDIIDLAKIFDHYLRTGEAPE